MNQSLKINFHFLDQCNYKCNCCFAEKNNNMLTLLEIKKIIDNIADSYFSKYDKNGKINLVGGEPLCCPYLQEIIDYAYSKNIEVSLVTNGSKLNEGFIKANTQKLSMIGISIDSLNADTNKLLGRCEKSKTLSTEQLTHICKLIKAIGIKLKINICVSKDNINEDMVEFLSEIQSDRVKIFQMKVVKGINEHMTSKQVSSEEFDKYCKKYEKFQPIIETAEEMKNSYVIINSKGDVYFDTNKEPLGNVLNETDFSEILERDSMNCLAYNKRYS